MKSELSVNSRTKKKIKRLPIDKNLLLLIFLILIMGTMMIFSASYPYAKSHYNDGAYYIKRQAVFLLIGIIAMMITSKVSINFYKNYSLYFYLICLMLLVLVLFGGFSEGVAKRWLGVPGTPLSFQPSELMKLGVILALSWYISNNQEKKIGYKKEILIPGIILFTACGLVLLEKHLSGTVIIALIGLSVLFISGTSIKKMFLTYGVSALAGGAIFLLTNSYAMKRIESFLNPNADVLSDKWQTTQGLYAIGSGGLFGLGYMNSRQKYSYVSEPQNDFIFTIWCEEMGYIGAIVLIMVYLLLILRGYKIAFSANDSFSAFVAFGITSQVAIQALLNMLVVTDLIPNTGISLPFFSYGGSSLVILLAEMGILLAISRYSKVKWGNMRILFCGGGTAGHVYPNLAIAQIFERNESNLHLAYVTTKNGIENEIIPFKKYEIDVMGIKKIFSFKNFKVFKLLVESIKESKKIIKEFVPDIIVGTGGYATFPVIYAGHKLGIKTVLHESNSIPGKAIKSLEKYADKIFVNFEDTKDFFKNKEKVIRTGNPMRQEYLYLNKKQAKENLGFDYQNVVVCFGGSLGAEKINESAINLIENFIKYRQDVLLIWATGKKNYNRCITKLKDKGLFDLKNIRVSSYICNMPEILSSADIVVCRAGAMTISEVALCGKCAIFVPSPNVANNHQYKNAKAICDSNGGLLISENELYKLTDEIKELINNTNKRREYEENIKKFAINDANKLIYKEILNIIKY